MSFVYPSSHQRAGGVTMLYEFTNAMARNGHEAHFVHGPWRHDLVESIDKIPFTFDPAVQHHIVHDVNDPSLPKGDVRFGSGAERMGHPAVIVQGFRLIGPVWDGLAYRTPMPKVCVASWLVDVGRAYGVPEAQLQHVPMGMDHELFALRTDLNDREYDVAMLYHPNREKGWSVGRRVLAELSRRRPDFRAVVFSMAGAPAQPLPRGVELMLDLNQQQLADDVYNATKVLVQASIHEGFGLTAIEAMGCGTALVSTDCGGSRDYAFHGETALVVPSGDVTGLADSVETLLDDDRQRVALATAGERSVRKFQWARSAELLGQYLDRYLADPQAFLIPPGEDRSKEYTL